MSDNGSLTVTGWRRVVLGVVFWLVAFCLMCGLGLAVGLVQAAAEAPSGAPRGVPGNANSIECRWGRINNFSEWYVRCNIGIKNEGGPAPNMVVRYCTSACASSTASSANMCTWDPGGMVCRYNFTPGPSPSPTPAGVGNNLMRVCYSGLTNSNPFTCSGGEVVLSGTNPLHTGITFNTVSPYYPAPFDNADLWCSPNEDWDCYREAANECAQLTFTGPPADRPWRGGEYVNIRVDIPEGVPAPELFFYWPGTVFHPDMWHDSETGYPRDPQIDYPHLDPGDVEIPRFFVNYPDRWAFPSNEFEPLTWFADRTETIRPFRDPRATDGTVGQLRIACAFLRADGWHLSVMAWDGSTEATPTEHRSCLDLTIDRPNWTLGDPNYPPDPGPWRVFSRTGAALGPLDVEVWDPTAGEWVTWLTALELDAYEVLEEPDSIPPVEIANPDAYSFRCIDEDGELTGGTLGEVDPAKAADGSRENCNESGIGVAPSSWVPGLVRMGSCVARKLFVPGDADIARIRAAGAEASHRAPISFIAEPGGVLIRAFTDAPATIEAHREDCLLIVDVSTLLDGVDDVSACPHSLETTGSSFALSGLRSILATCWWLAFAWFLWSSTRRVMGL